MSPRLRELAVISPEHDALAAVVFATERHIEAAAADESQQRQLQIDLAEHIAALDTKMEGYEKDRRGALDRFQKARELRNDAGADLARTDSDLGQLAATVYIGADERNSLVDLTTVSPARLRLTYTNEILDDALVRRRKARSRVDAGSSAMDEEEINRRLAEANMKATTNETATSSQRLAQAGEDELTARQLQVALTTRLEGERRAVAEARRTAKVVGLDFTLVVLDAYVAAERRLAETDPGCGIRWESIAAIARTESRHGTHGGAAVGVDGKTTQLIIGIPLDGTNGTLEIPDTDDGRLDQDTVNDRAVGPLQFIPTSWKQYGRDSNGDDVRDPHNMYDAALSAGVHLCASGTAMNSDAGLRAAYLDYNRSQSYAQSVIDQTHAYDDFGL